MIFCLLEAPGPIIPAFYTCAGLFLMKKWPRGKKTAAFAWLNEFPPFFSPGS